MTSLSLEQKRLIQALLILSVASILWLWLCAWQNRRDFITRMNIAASSVPPEIISPNSEKPPIDLTKVDCNGPMPPPGHDIYALPVARPSEISSVDEFDLSPAKLLFHLTDMELRITELEGRYGRTNGSRARGSG